MSPKKMKIKSKLWVLFIIICWTAIYAEHVRAFSINGTVTDSISGEPLSYASVMLKRAGWGHLTDNQGRYKIDDVKRGDTLVVSLMGYTTFQKVIETSQRLNIKLNPTGVKLKEVIVKPRKTKYSKKDNPAVDFVNKIRNTKDINDPRKQPYYSNHQYERLTIGLNNMDPNSEKNLFTKQFKMLKNYIDTSEVSGKGILNISCREKSAHNYYRNSPPTHKVLIDGVSQVGLDDFMDQENMRVLYEDFFSNIDLYQNDVYLLHNQFVSPLSPIAPDFYKFYLTDTISIDSIRCIELSFVPHNSQTFGFTGKLYVDMGDTTMFIRRIQMSVPEDINLNFIDKIYINQEYKRADNGSRLLTKDDLIAELSIIPGTQGIYFRRNTAYDSHSFDSFEDNELLYKLGKNFFTSDYQKQDSVFWAENRIIPFTYKEARLQNMVSGIRDIPLYYWSEKILKIFVNGYITTSPISKFDIGPVNTIISHNSVEGYRLRLGGMTTANLNKRLFFRGYGAYGTKDHKWKYNAELEYSFTDKKYHPREFPINALRFTHSYDMDMIGQHYEFTNPDNMFLSFKRHEDYLMSYLRTAKLEYILELNNNLSFKFGVYNERQESTPWVPFVTSSGENFSHYTQNGINIEVRYAPGEKFYQTKTHRIAYTPEYPTITLKHTYSPKHVLGNPFDINKTELSIQKRFWFSAFGYLDAIVKGSYLWGISPYPNLAIPNANLSYTIQPESFALMNPMEFVTDRNVTWDLTYWANGAIFNYIPLIKKLKLREAFSFRGIYGGLRDCNNPSYNTSLFTFPVEAQCASLGKTPYMEAGVGIDNLFKILRVDYVWRLTHRNIPGADRRGVRIALHFTF